jgi:hypothetical protein
MKLVAIRREYQGELGMLLYRKYDQAHRQVPLIQ